jgi:serine/threonine protein kinase
MATPNGYQITETIFSNQFTRVFRAQREADGLSVILRTGGEQAMPSQCARLSYVADVLKKFQHRNISELIEWNDTSSQCWLVLEDIHAIDLMNYLDRFDKHRLPLEIFWPLALQIADALSVIHHEQVIHKDLHPRNIVVNPDTLQCQIIDFGLASLLTREQPTLTSPNQLQGSLSFLSPEQTGRIKPM